MDSKSLTVFCFLVVRPIPRELHLLPHHNLSECDDAAVFSNVSVTIRQQRVSAALHGSMDVRGSAYHGFALNVQIFLQVWKQLAARLLSYSWVVKIDVDSVLLMPHLRRMLRTVPTASLLTNP